MKKMIGGVLALLLVVSIGLVVAQNEEVSGFTSVSVSPLVEVLRELVGVQGKIADGVPLKGEYLVNEEGTASFSYQTYRVMPVGTCDYAFYALESGKLVTNKVKLDIARWNGEAYGDLSHGTTGTLTFDDNYYMIYLNMTSTVGNFSLSSKVGHFEYSCN